MNFSQRQGLKPAQKPLQLGDMDAELRCSLWNAFELVFWRKMESQSSSSEFLGGLLPRFWLFFFRRPLGGMSEDPDLAVKSLRRFFFACTWNEVYDAVEFAADNCPVALLGKFIECCNGFLETENSGYRFVGTSIMPITSPQELGALSEALEKSVPLHGVHKHLETAIALFSDRKKPDYRNSIKESISAVESLARVLTGSASATLGDALKVLEKEEKLHPALKNSFSALYGYTSDAKGIRHAMLEEEKITFADAKYMLIACSAFINYMIEKAGEFGIALKAPPEKGK